MLIDMDYRKLFVISAGMALFSYLFNNNNPPVSPVDEICSRPAVSINYASSDRLEIGTVIKGPVGCCVEKFFAMQNTGEPDSKLQLVRYTKECVNPYGHGAIPQWGLTEYTELVDEIPEYKIPYAKYLIRSSPESQTLDSKFKEALENLPKKQ